VNWRQIWYTGSRWHTLDLHKVTSHIKHPVPLCHWGLYHGTEKKLSSVRSQVTACFKSASVANGLPARCILHGPEMEITGSETGTVGRVYHNLLPKCHNQLQVHLAVWNQVFIMQNNDALAQQSRPFATSALL
jgi:hypothetical protein